jgi:uncharacterized membrane protein YdjX (TVP38/TMEM64 family)
MRQAMRRIGLAGLVGLSVAAMFYVPGLLAAGLIEWLRDAGPAGIGVYVAVFIVAAVCMVPGSILTLGAGAAYGPLAGGLIALPASVAAAAVAFGVGRLAARGWIVRRGSDERVAALDAAVEQHGLKLVVLIRLSPLVPFNVLNYALGLTRVRFRDFVVGSFVGLLPVTLLYAYLGSVAASALAAPASGATPAGLARHALTAIGLAATLGLTVWVTRVARRAMPARI